MNIKHVTRCRRCDFENIREGARTVMFSTTRYYTYVHWKHYSTSIPFKSVQLSLVPVAFSLIFLPLYWNLCKSFHYTSLLPYLGTFLHTTHVHGFKISYYMSSKLFRSFSLSRSHPKTVLMPLCLWSHICIFILTTTFFASIM